MIDSELILFFNNADKLTSFERKRKIYDLTNNLDINLLLDLKKEFELFFVFKLQEIAREMAKTGVEVVSPTTSAVPTFGNGANPILPVKADKVNEVLQLNELVTISLNEYIDDFLVDNDYSIFENLGEKTAGFKEDLDELIVRQEKLSGKTQELVDYDILVDLSDTTPVNKVIYLEKLGIINFLRKTSPFNTSVNSLANVLSAVTGVKPGALQPMLNPMISTGVIQKNNPMKSKNTVNVVENKLIQIGFNLEKK